MQCKAMAGKITHYNPQVEMVGAENRGNVTCYLDSLLFAMFAKLDAFECMLKNDFTDEPRRRLVTLLRLWVNMLRSGEMIHVDMVSWFCAWNSFTVANRRRQNSFRMLSPTAAGATPSSSNNKIPPKPLLSLPKRFNSPCYSYKSTCFTRERTTRTTTN